MNTFFLKRAIRKMTGLNARTKSFKEYRDIHRVLLLFEPEHLSDVESFAKSLMFAGKEVQAYSFDEKKKNLYPQLLSHFKIWNKDQLNLFGIPLPEEMVPFRAFVPDTLIDLTQRPNAVLEYLSLSTQADYRVAIDSTRTNIHDLIIDSQPEQDFSFLVSQLHFYMKSLKTK